MLVIVEEGYPSPWLSVGDYKVGTTSPRDIPKEAYEKSEHKDKLVVVEEEESETSEEETDLDKLANDYLDQNARTVIKSLREDNLSDNMLKTLKKEEEADKDRVTVKRQIDKELGE